MPNTELFLNQKRSDSIFNELPSELRMYILSFLRDIRVVLFLGSMNKATYELVNDNHTWIALYRRNIGPLVDTTNAKLQYIAEHLYQRASTCKRSDLAQLHYKSLHTFLIPFERTSWAKRYLAEMLSFGRGITKNADKGGGYIHEGIAAKDYRIVSLIIDNDIAPKHFTPAEIASFLPILVAAWEQEAKKVACQIAKIYKTGIGVSENKALAKEWLKCGFNYAISCDDVEMVKKTISSVPADELEHLSLNFTGSTQILGAIWYHIALINRHDSTIRKPALLEASKCGNTDADCFIVNRELGKPHSSAMTIAEHYERGFKNNDYTCTRFFLKFIKNTPYVGDYKFMEIFADYKRAFAEKNNEAAAVSIYMHVKFNGFEILEDTWWTQIAAQCGVNEALNKLNQPGVYYRYCARAIIYEFGIKDSNIKIDPEFARANLDNLEDVGLIQDYLEFGIKLGIITDEAKKFLQDYCHSRTLEEVRVNASSAPRISRP